MIATPIDLSAEADLDLLEEFLMSDRAPEDCMQLSDLDGFLVGIAVGPDLIGPSEFLPVVWGDGEPDFSGVDEARAVLGAIMCRYNDILRCLSDRSQDYAPIILQGPNGEIVASDWAIGFMDAVRLRKQSWDSLFRDQHGSMALLPILLLASSEDMVPPEIAAAVKEKDFLKDAHDYIPACVIAIDDFWRKRRRRTPLVPRHAEKTGRNDPCPCGSGRKYKKCCGAN